MDIQYRQGWDGNAKTSTIVSICVAYCQNQSKTRWAMGAIKIHLNKPDKIYVAGELLEGSVTIHNTKDEKVRCKCRNFMWK